MLLFINGNFILSLIAENLLSILAFDVIDIVVGVCFPAEGLPISPSNSRRRMLECRDGFQGFAKRS